MGAYGGILSVSPRRTEGMIKTLLWDVDGTLLDFHAAEKYGMTKCMAEIGVTLTDEMLAVYSVINRSWWERHEQGLATREEIFAGRLRDFFEQYGIMYTDYDGFNRQYQIALGEAVFPMDDSLTLLAELKKTHKIYMVTNGSKLAQELKLAKSGIDKLTHGVFISEDVGVQKPDKAFFDRVQEATGYVKEETMIIGDSLSSDIKGGNNAGIKTCWYNPKGAKQSGDAKVDYEIRNLWEIVEIVR